MTAFDELRDANPVAELPTPPPVSAMLARIETAPAAETPAAVDRAQFRGAQVRRLRVRAAGPLAVVGGVLAALAVLVIALTAHSGRTGPKPLPVPASTPKKARPLVSRLRVLRRPQTAADRAVLAMPIAEQISAQGRILPGLARLARTLPDGTRVYFLVVAPDRRLKLAGDLLEIVRDQRDVQNAATAGTPALQPSSPGPYGLFSTMGDGAAGAFVPAGTLQYYEIVPDGVATVRWSFPRQSALTPGSILPGTPGQVFPAPLVVNVPVRNNLAAMVLPIRGPATVETFYDAAGHVVASNGGPRALSRIAAAREPAAPTARSRAAERDPSTPNPVRVTTRPFRHGRRLVTVSFHVLIPNVGYRFSVAGGHHPGCAPSLGNDIESEQIARGQIFRFGFEAGRGWCAGSYRIAVAVNGHAPFGSATFTVR